MYSHPHQETWAAAVILHLEMGDFAICDRDGMPDARCKNGDMMISNF
jgi:hypothetical protein